MKHTSIKTILCITIFMNTSYVWSMEEDSTYLSVISTISTQAFKKLAKELSRESYLNNTESQDLYKELDDRIKQGNLKNSKADTGFFKLQNRVAERSWTAQVLIAQALKEGNTRKMMSIAKEHSAVIPPLLSSLIEQIRTEELAELQKHEKELSEFTPFKEQAKTPTNAKKDASTSKKLYS